MKQCPACGNAVDGRSDACTFCGHSFTGRPNLGQDMSTSPYAPQARSGPRLGVWLTIFFVLAVTGAIAAALFFVGREVNEEFGSIGTDSETETGEVFSPKRLDTSAEGAYEGIRPLVAELGAGGVSCKRVNVLVKNSTLQAGTCFIGAESLSIQVYFSKLAFDASVSSMKSSVGANLAFGKNWTVLAPTSVRLTKQVAEALDGRTG